MFTLLYLTSLLVTCGVVDLCVFSIGTVAVALCVPFSSTTVVPVPFSAAPLTVGEVAFAAQSNLGSVPFSLGSNLTSGLVHFGVAGLAAGDVSFCSQRGVGGGDVHADGGRMGDVLRCCC